MDAGQLQYGGMGGMGGYARAGGMSGRETTNSASDGPVPSSGVRTDKENLQTALSQGRLRGELRSSSSLEALADAAKSLRRGPAPQAQEQEVAQETNGDGVAAGARLSEAQGKKPRDTETGVVWAQVSSSPGARRSVTPETSAKFDEKVGYAWSGTLAPGKPAVTMVIPPPAESAVASDKEVGQRLGINGSVKDNKSVPALGGVPITGELFDMLSPAERKAKAESLLEERQRAENSPGRPLVQAVPAPAQRGPETAAPLDVLVAQDASGVPAQSHFKVVPVNPWVMTDRDAFSTFGLDVDTASYALCQRFIRGGFLPPVGAVRMEEFVNAFDYAYPQRDDATFAVHAEGAPSPFAPAGQDLVLLKVAVKARTVGRDQRRATNLIFVVDASASMGQADRLPLVQSVSNQLVDKLSEGDRISLVTCANEARLHLEAVSARQKDTIHQTINAIQPAGPTNLLAGLKLGYEMARKSFVAGQTNQVVLCSDGVANVGQTEAEEMLKEVAEDRKQAITLTCVGVGYGAYNDAFLEALADQGDGRYVFLDSSAQAQEALVGQLAGSLQNVATDARIQVQFNLAQVRRYRLIGYENRDIEDQRFRDDTVEAGAVGSGQCSTALYELELTGSRVEPDAQRPFGPRPPSNRGQDARDTEAADLGTVFVRYRNTDTGQIEEISRPLANALVRRRSVEDDPRFFLAAGAARFAEWLRQSEHARQTSLGDVQRLLDQVSAALPLDRQAQDLAALAHQAEGLPGAPETPEGKS
jgi:Ca-activated chloride channel family protein